MVKHTTLALCAVLMTATAAHAEVIHPGLDTTLCLDVAGGSSANGTRIQIAHCYSNDAAQDFTMVGNTLRVLGKCLDVTNGSTANYTQLQIYDCGAGDNANQQFVLDSGTIAWKNHHTCLDVPNGRANDGQPIQMYSCSSSDKSEQWQTHLSSGSASAAPAPGPTAAPSGGRLMGFVNKCSEPVKVTLQNNADKPVPSPSSFTLLSGQSQSVALPPKWGGRMWGGGVPASLVEFLFDGYAGPTATQDYYDISLVDAFNLPIAIQPNGGTGSCHAPSCSNNILNSCPSDLQVKDSTGKVVTCLSACSKYQTDDTCCRGAHNTPATCPAPSAAKLFKQACHDAYSYAYDDGTSTWNCSSPTGYTITFCP